MKDHVKNERGFRLTEAPDEDLLIVELEERLEFTSGLVDADFSESCNNFCHNFYSCNEADSACCGNTFCC